MTRQIGITHRERKAVENIHVLFLPFAKSLHILGIHLTSFRGTITGSFVKGVVWLRRWRTNAHNFRESMGLVEEDGTHHEHCRLRSREFVLCVGVRPEVELALHESYEGRPVQPFSVVAVKSAVQEK
jgi:hypothetical protein